MNATLQELIDAELREHTAPDLALGFLRYEQSRNLMPSKLLELRRCTVEQWNDIIDAMIVKNAKEQP